MNVFPDCALFDCTTSFHGVSRTAPLLTDAIHTRHDYRVIRQIPSWKRGNGDAGNFSPGFRLFHAGPLIRIRKITGFQMKGAGTCRACSLQ